MDDGAQIAPISQPTDPTGDINGTRPTKRRATSKTPTAINSIFCIQPTDCFSDSWIRTNACLFDQKLERPYADTVVDDSWLETARVGPVIASTAIDSLRCIRPIDRFSDGWMRTNALRFNQKLKRPYADTVLTIPGRKQLELDR